MKSYLFSIFIITATLAAFSFSAAAQVTENPPPNKEKPTVTDPQKKVRENSSATDESELSEAVRFLNKTDGNFSDLKIYKLAGTDKSDIAPQIADTVIKSGKEVERLQKIADKVLRYHKLTDICSVILFEDENPRVFTYRLRSISFSTNIFNNLTDDEVTALITHETGHLYFGDDLAEARQTDNDKLARLVELKCDVISLITLKNLGIDPAVLISALKKLIRAREKAGLQTTTDQSPSLTDRINLTEIFLEKKVINSKVVRKAI